MNLKIVSHNIRCARGRRLLSTCALAGALLGGWSSLQAAELDGTGTLWEPVMEWSFQNPSSSGNPFDLVATATFVHSESGETRTTPFFYDGGDTWKVRFTATRVGTWTVSTASGDSDLDGKLGTVEIQPNPDPEVRGFVVAHGSKFAKQSGPNGELEAFVPNIYMNLRKFGNPEKCGWTDMSPTYSDPDVFEAYLDEIEEHGSNTAFALLGNQWFKSGAVSSSDHNSEDPDLETFRVLEQAIQQAQKRGMHLEMWAWGDESRDWTPTKVGGVNGVPDRRIQRYIAARLGPLPAWTMGYGFDLSEWASANDVESWEEYINDHSGWEHLLSAREDGSFPDLEDLPVGGYDDEPEDDFYDAARNLLDNASGRPGIFLRRFSYMRDDVWTMDATRQAFWQFTLAGGAASIWGLYPPDCSAYYDGTYPDPHQLNTHLRFWKKRFLLDMQPANNLSENGNTMVLREDDNAVFYRENTSSIHLDLSGMKGVQPVIAVDTLKEYAEIDVGLLTAEAQTWHAPYSSDWALAVGSFSIEIEDPVAPAIPANLTVSGLAEERIDITWQAPYNGGSPITGYRIQRKGPGESSFSDLQENTGDTITSYSDQGLALESTYSYRVAAINAIGESEFSDEVTATTGEPTIPVFNLANFGAVGDGVADDTQALRDAIEHFGSEGLPLGIPAGRYRITGDISIGRPVQFVGIGNQEAIITSNNGSARLFVRESGTSFTDIGFEDMIEPIALESRSGYVLENLLFERCRFENLSALNSNRGVIGLPGGGSSERAPRIDNLVVRDCTFRNIDANAINIRANISGSQVVGNEFIDIINVPGSASPPGAFVIRLGDPDEAHAVDQGGHLIADNIIRNVTKSTVDGNLIGILLYGDHSIIRNNLIEDIDGTETGVDTNAIYIRGSFNEILANTIRNIRGTGNNGAIHIKGDMALGNRNHIISGNVIENIQGMFAVEAFTSELLLSGNEITDAPFGAFVHRQGSNVTVVDNTFTTADVLLQTDAGEASVSGNNFFESRISLSQGITPAAREVVSIHANLFRRTLAESPIPMIRLSDAVAEESVSILNNRIENLVAGEGILVDLITGGTLQTAAISGNTVIQNGDDIEVFLVDSPNETIEDNDITYGNDPGPSPTEPGMPVDVALEMNGEELSIQWTGLEGFLYQIQVSSDLQTWSDHGEAIPGNGTRIEVTDLPGEETAATFYRVTVQASEG